MSLVPIAHAGHWLAGVGVYGAPVIVLVIAFLVSAARHRRAR